MYLSTILVASLANFALARPNLHHHHRHGGPRRQSAVSLDPNVGGTQLPSISTTTDIEVTHASTVTTSEDSAAVVLTNTQSIAADVYLSSPLSDTATPRVSTLATSLPITAPRLEAREPQWTTYVFTQLLSENVTVVMGPMTEF